MEDKLKKIVEKLTTNHKTIATMESCTGGALADAITNIEGASKVFNFGAVTYSNDFKIKLGVDPNIIEEHSVYSQKTASDMAYKISLFALSNYGVGITGKLFRADENNPYGKDNVVFISIYNRDKNKYYNFEIEVIKESRRLNKQLVLNNIITNLNNILDCEE